jgi:hypothetical protein
MSNHGLLNFFVFVSFLCCVRVVSGVMSIATAIYRPGSSAITTAFFVELADVLDRLAIFVKPVLVTGDVNIRLERSTDAETSIDSKLRSYARGVWPRSMQNVCDP